MFDVFMLFADIKFINTWNAIAVCNFGAQLAWASSQATQSPMATVCLILLSPPSPLPTSTFLDFLDSLDFLTYILYARLQEIDFILGTILQSQKFSTNGFTANSAFLAVSEGKII